MVGGIPVALGPDDQAIASREAHKPGTAMPSPRTSERSEILATTNNHNHATPTCSVSAQVQVVSRDSGNSLSNMQTCDASSMPRRDLPDPEWSRPKSHASLSWWRLCSVSRIKQRRLAYYPSFRLVLAKISLSYN